jgi:protein phosphatase
VAIVLDLSETVCARRNAMRADRAVALAVLRSQRVALRRSLGSLRKEGFGRVHVLRRVEEVEAASSEPRETDRRGTDRLDDPRP